MRFAESGWQLDHERLASAVGPRTRALFLVSPSNPTGWTATLDDLRMLLALARRHGLWIVADETYARFWYGEGARAPSFFDVMEPDDRILFVNTFSKNWAMTGWRVGWIDGASKRLARRSKTWCSIPHPASRNSCSGPR